MPEYSGIDRVKAALHARPLVERGGEVPEPLQPTRPETAEEQLNRLRRAHGAPAVEKPQQMRGIGEERIQAVLAAEQDAEQRYPRAADYEGETLAAELRERNAAALRHGVKKDIAASEQLHSKWLRGHCGTGT